LRRCVATSSIKVGNRLHCERFLTKDELASLGDVLDAMRTGKHPARRGAAAVISLLLLTGCRYREIMDLQWPDVKGNRLKLRDSKTGPRTVWLGAPARAIIDGLPRRQNNPWLFWNERTRQRLKDISHIWIKVREEAGLGKLRIHDLRHTFASHAAMSKETLPMIGRFWAMSIINRRRDMRVWMTSICLMQPSR
jgi:integrase